MSLRSFKAGLSKSYHSLNTLGQDSVVDSESGFRQLNPKPKKRSKTTRFLKNAMSRVAPRSNGFRGSHFSVAVKDMDNDWSIPEEYTKSFTTRKLGQNRMSASMTVPAEQASLLGNLSDGVDDVELRHIQLSVATARNLGDDGSAGQRQTVDTRHGAVCIAIAGDLAKPPIVTFHDIGLNHITNFQAFMMYPDMKNLLNSFCVIHINAPGQEEGAPRLPEGYVYPTMDELAEIVNVVKMHLHLKSFIGLGVGLGANVLCRYAVKYPEDVNALLVVNCSSTTAGWLEWGYQKMNVRQLSKNNLAVGTVDYLMWHHFGKTDECNQDLVAVYRQHFEKSLNAFNLGLLLDSYIRRTDLGIMRQLDVNKKKDTQMIRCSLLNMTAIFSPHKEDTVTFNARLDPSISTWMKIQDCGLVIDEQPGKVVEAFRLFLQGLGYAVNGSRRSSSISFGEGKSC